MTSAVLMVIYAVLASTFGTRALLRARWVVDAPRLAVVAWQGLMLSVLASAVAAMLSLSFGFLRLCHEIVVFVHLCVTGLANHYQPQSGGLLGIVGLGFLAMTGARLAWSLAVVARAETKQRRRTISMLDIVARRDVVPDVLVLEHEAAYAFCLPGSDARVVVTRGLLESLSPDEVTAVLAHERAHIRQRHHLVLLFSSVLCRAFSPVAPWLRVAEEQMARLLEMCADDAACRSVNRETLRVALSRLVPGRATPMLLGASVCAVGERLERLGTQRRFRPAVVVGATAVVLALAPAALVVLDLAFGGLCLPA